tara:strand:- start:1343 stop:1978 length:636 start_codon:yes stop_codon:yes gene_type:complete
MNEIEECMKNIINKVDLIESDIIKAKSLDGKLIIINTTELRNNHLLDGANVFKILFKIEKSSFADLPLETDEDNNITILKDLGIYAEDWYQFISFVKHGFPPRYVKNNKENPQDFIITKIENLNETCNKFGGIPSFDHFYRNYYKDINNDSKFYNPMRAEKDYLKLYDWRVIKEEQFNNLEDYKDWSVTEIERKGITDYIWLRKEKGERVE